MPKISETIRPGADLRDLPVADPVIVVYSGDMPVDCAAPDPAREIARVTLPADWHRWRGGVLP